MRSFVDNVAVKSSAEMDRRGHDTPTIDYRGGLSSPNAFPVGVRIAALPAGFPV